MATAATIRQELSQKKAEVDELKAKAHEELERSIDRLLELQTEAVETTEAIRNLRATISEIDNSSPYLMIFDFLRAGLTGMDQLVEATGLKANTIFQFLQALEKKGTVKRELEPGRKRGGKYTIVPEKYTLKQRKEMSKQAHGEAMEHLRKKKLAAEAEASSDQQPTA